MPTRALHLVIHPDDPVVRAVLARQPAEPDRVVTILDLTKPEIDYPALLEEIFAADVVAVW